MPEEKTSQEEIVNRMQEDVRKMQEQMNRVWGTLRLACETLDAIHVQTFDTSETKIYVSMGVVRERCRSFLESVGWAEFKKKAEEAMASAANSETPPDPDRPEVPQASDVNTPVDSECDPDGSFVSDRTPPPPEPAQACDECANTESK